MLSILLLLGAGAITALASELKVEVPLAVSAALMSASLVLTLVAVAKRRIGPISALAHLTFCLPFVHFIPYIFDAPPPDAPLLWGLVPNPFMFNFTIIKLTAALGAIGSCAMSIGYLSSARSFQHVGPIFHRVSAAASHSLSLWMTIIIASTALVLATISAPRATIFEAVYTGEDSVADRINFNSAWLVASVLLLLILSDALVDSDIVRARIKTSLAIVCSFYFVVWLQFARGNRETLFFTVALGYLMWVWGAPHLSSSSRSRNVIRVLSVAGVITTLGCGYVLQKYRYELAPNASSFPKIPEDRMPSVSNIPATSSVATLPTIEQNIPIISSGTSLSKPPAIAADSASQPVVAAPDSASQNSSVASVHSSNPSAVTVEPTSQPSAVALGTSSSNPSVAIEQPLPVAPGTLFKRIDIRIPSGTWSGVLLTAISVAGADSNGTLGRAWGKTYVDFLLSLPPGFFADFVGYRRPIDAKNGPAHHLQYGIGGLHAIVVPMINFGAFGILAVLTLSGWFIAATEKISADVTTPAFLASAILFQGVIITITPHWLWYGEKSLMTGLAIWGILVFIYVTWLRRKMTAAKS